MGLISRVSSRTYRLDFRDRTKIEQVHNKNDNKTTSLRLPTLFQSFLKNSNQKETLNPFKMQNLFRKKKPKNPEQIIPTPDETYSTSSGCSSGMLLSKKEGGFATPIQICSDISLEASNKNSEEVRVRSSNHKQRSQRRAPIIGGQNNQANNNNILPT